MKITSIFDENGRTLQEVMEQFLIIYYYDYVTNDKERTNEG